MSPLSEAAPYSAWLELTGCLLDSFRRWTGKELLERGSPEEDLFGLWNAPDVVVSHGIQSDPIFQYGNQQALSLWEMRLDEFLILPSRLTAEPLHQDERQRLLERTRQFGYVDDYRGVRISRTGKRFMIEKALLWTVIDCTGKTIGQAATFDHWSYL